MSKAIPIDPHGERLWINVEMNGLYFITYTYQLWAATTAEPPVLTNPLKSGSNESPHDDHYPVINDYNQAETVASFIGRVIDVRFWIKSSGNDDGYTLKVNVLQGDDLTTAVLRGSDVAPHNSPGKVGSASGLKQEFIIIKLVTI